MALKKSDKEYIENLAFNVVAGVPMITAPLDDRPVKIYVVAFDGTLNDRERVNPSERPTAVAEIARKLESDQKLSPMVHVEYHPGAGMQGPITNPADAAIGYSGTRVAETSVTSFYKQASAWLKENPRTEIRVFVTGFSRGAATARHFMNRVDSTWSEHFGNAGAPSNEPSPRQYAVLYDTVATYQEQLELGLPASVDYLVHFIAFDEVRNKFIPVHDVDPNFLLVPTSSINGIGRTFKSDRMTVVLMPGAHSDIGTSYRSGIGAYYLSITEQLLHDMGLTETNCWELPGDVFNAGMHDSRGLLDRFVGTAAPDEILVSREHMARQSAKLTPEARTRLRGRVSRLMMAGADGQHFSTRYTSRTESIAFSLKKLGDSLEIISPIDKYIAPDSVRFFVDIAHQRRLAYRLVNSADTSSFIITDRMWNMLQEGATSELSLSVLTHERAVTVSFYVDGINAGDLRMDQRAENSGQKLMSKCTTEARSALQIFVLPLTVNQTQ
ncbi:phospholipase effector Tle1 domain-containing protein [Undibacterium sp.]|uniref:phospholipase effector Tle1 domain-containing protein n=1 Tax=Undibacterium sp. TaxID=1914977 RepID=UPI002CCE8D60|nr:DUF2235 domain-containing protein [Undibacterium sp.]HTD06806.1 DUF2235 domain-containing protein [Undibacterium sp.]